MKMLRSALIILLLLVLSGGVLAQDTGFMVPTVTDSPSLVVSPLPDGAVATDAGMVLSDVNLVPEWAVAFVVIGVFVVLTCIIIALIWGVIQIAERSGKNVSPEVLSALREQGAYSLSQAQLWTEQAKIDASKTKDNMLDDLLALGADATVDTIVAVAKRYGIPVKDAPEQKQIAETG